MKNKIPTYLLMFSLNTLFACSSGERIVASYEDEENSSSSSSYTPNQALDDLNSGELKFIGREIMPGSDQNRSCIYKNNSVYLVYGNCMGNKKEGSATDFQVINMKGHQIKFYHEPFSDDAPSSLQRSQYDGTWSISYVKSDVPGNISGIVPMQNYLKKNLNFPNGVCYIGNSFRAKDPTATASCSGPMKPYQPSWAPAAESFWSKPTADWYSTQASLRKLIIATKY